MNRSKRTFLKLLGTGTVVSACSSNDPNNDSGNVTNPSDQSQQTDTAAGQPEWKTQGIEVPELAGFDRMMQEFMRDRNIPGGTLAVARNEKLCLARGYSYTNDASIPDIQPTSLFRIASISKPVTSTAVMRLVQDNQIDLTNRVTEILSLTPAQNRTVDDRLANITVQHLLQHLGGWDSETSFDPMFRDATIADELNVFLPITTDNIITYMAGRPLQHPPGTRYAYSNFGYSLLGKVIQAVSGQTYQEYVKQTIFAPLNITRPVLGRTLLENKVSNEVDYYSSYNRPTVFDRSGSQVPSPYGGWNIENMDAHGGWLASAVDLVRFASTFDNPAFSPILNQVSVDNMFGLPENIAQENYSPGAYYYANGWVVRDYGNGMRNTWHNGSLPGTSTLLVRRRDGLNWCVLFNQREESSGLSYSDIDGLLHGAANSVTQWPDHDLFDIYL